MLTAAMQDNLKEGDLVLYKDFTESYWQIGIYAGYDKNTENKCKHRIMVNVMPDDEGNPDTKSLTILPYRYAVKLDLKMIN